MEGPHLGSLARFLTAGTLAALLLTAVDGPRMWMRLGDTGVSDQIEALSVMLTRTLALCGAFGCAAWIATRLFLGLRSAFSSGRWGALVPYLIVAGLAAPGVMWFAGRLLSGAQISQHERIELLRIAVPVAGCIAVAFAAMVLAWAGIASARGSRFAAWSVGALCFLAFAALDWWDNTQFRTASYDYVHGIAAGGAMVAAYSGWLLLTTIVARLRRNATASGALLILAAGVVATWLAPESTFARFALEQRSLRGKRLIMVSDRVFPNRLPEEETVVADAELAKQRQRAAQSRSGIRRLLDSKIGARDDWNLLWITIDTLRADHLSCYGYERATSPTIDAFARQSVLFENNYAQNSITHFSFQSMFYGRYASATPLFRKMRQLPDDAERSLTLAAYLTQRGFETACLPAIPATSLTHPVYEVLAGGFSSVNPGRTGNQLDAGTQSTLAIRWLKSRRDGRWFLWLHFFDPHRPYRVRGGSGFGLSNTDRYDSEILYVDGEVKKVLQALGERSDASKTVVVVNADHGEALGDHDSDYHGSTLYDEQIKVPLVIRVPGLSPSRVRTVVENVDIMPTVLDVLDLGHDLPLQGESLVPLLLDGDDEAQMNSAIAFSELPGGVSELSPELEGMATLRMGDLKLIHTPRRRMSELYDLSADPGELNNLAFERTADVARLRAAMEVLREECKDVNVPEEKAETNPLDELRSKLGTTSVPKRCKLLVTAIRSELDGLETVLFERIEDAKEHFSVKGIALRHAIGADRRRAVPAAQAALDQRLSWGIVQSTLEGLHELRTSELVELRGDLSSRIVKLVTGPPSVARRAARILSRMGDASGVEILKADAAGADRSVAFDSACALAFAGDAEHAELIRASLFERKQHPADCARALRALAALRDTSALTEVTRLVEDVFLPHGIKQAAIEYLAELGGERVVPAFVHLLKGWDPAVTRSVEKVLDGAFGESRRRDLRKAAQLSASASDLLDQGRWIQACDDLAKAATACGTPRAAIVMNLYAARAASYTNDRRRLDRFTKAVLAVKEKTPYHRAARALAAGRRRPGPSEGISILGMEYAPGHPLTQGAAVAVRLRLRNDGDKWLPGGSWSGGIVTWVRWKNTEGREILSSAPTFLSEHGLDPGAEHEVVISTQVPRVTGVVTLVGSVRTPWGSRVDAGKDTVLTVWLSPEGEAGLDPRQLEFRGEAIRRRWAPGYVLTDLETEADGTVSLAAWAVDPWLIGPTLEDGGAPVEIAVELAIAPTSPPRTARLEVYWTHDPAVQFNGKQRASLEIPADGTYKRLVHVIPMEGGKAARRVRIDPSNLPDLYSIRAITIRAVR